MQIGTAKTCFEEGRKGNFTVHSIWKKFRTGGECLKKILMIIIEFRRNEDRVFLTDANEITLSRVCETL